MRHACVASRASAFVGSFIACGAIYVFFAVPASPRARSLSENHASPFRALVGTNEALALAIIPLGSALLLATLFLTCWLRRKIADSSATVREQRENDDQIENLVSGASDTGQDADSAARERARVAREEEDVDHLLELVSAGISNRGNAQERL
jgi:hypothetical protein